MLAFENLREWLKVMLEMMMMMILVVDYCPQAATKQENLYRSQPL